MCPVRSVTYVSGRSGAIPLLRAILAAEKPRFGGLFLFRLRTVNGQRDARGPGGVAAM
jgi:hypothetical protein